MVKRERSRAEIIHDVLEVTLNEENPRKTRIMHRSYLNTVTFNKYFDLMLNKGFIVKCNPETGCYKVTEKGKNLLSRLMELDEILISMGVPIIFIQELLF